MTDLSKVVLITGCSSGIGRATALRLAAGGWTVCATARRLESIAELEAQGCHTLALDVTDEASMQAAVQAIEETHGAVGVLINNAGYSQSGAVEHVPVDRVRRQLETNLIGPVRLAQLVLPGMRAQGWGKVVNLSSMGGKLTFPGGGVYHASKHALEAISDAMRFEVRGFGVDVIVIEPGIIKTGFSAAASSAMDGLDDGPYAVFNAAVDKATHDVYESGPLAALGGGPEHVAARIETAITARRPRARYKVTASAYVLMGFRRWAPDWLWDAFVAGSFPRPTS